MKIYHLHHSGFLIQFEDKTLIFDAFTHIPQQLLRKGIPHYFFVSHQHSDHYTQEIHMTDRVYKPVFILSDDISPVPGSHMISPYQHLSLGGMDIRTFGSTDRGVSFYVSTNSHHIFHAGDLNWWDWNPQKKHHLDLVQEEADFKREINRLKDLPMEIAFIPVDPRLEDSFYKAGKYFNDHFKPKVLIPMHFRDDFSIIKQFKEKIGESNTIIPDFQHRNMLIDIKK
ncbi:MBL fold metallo-hydrolase [Eubacteriaceae bacterium ES3]|nr:MBL fold metallo-hydrolase [Eubacteriaceae bacterium ES3]